MPIDGWTLAFQAVNFLVLVWLLRHFLYRPVRRIIDERRATAARALADAEAAQRQADETAREYQRRAEAVADERDQMLDDARAKIEGERQAMLAEARTEAEALQARTQRALGAEREAVAREIRVQAAELAIALARRLVADVAPGPLAETFVAETFVGRAADHLAALPRNERAALLAMPPGSRHIRVDTAPILDTVAQARCRTRLQAVLGGDCVIEFSEAPELIAGARLWLPAATLDLSWAATLEATKRDLAVHEAAE